MTKSAACDYESLRLVVRDGVQDSRRSQLEEHLAACAACRHELERLSGGADWLCEVRKHLSSSEIRTYSASETPSTGRNSPWNCDESQGGDLDQPDAGDKLDFLEPSDDPTKLGRLGAYEIDSVIGRGGMGIVLKAYDSALNRHVAIKVLAAQLATSGAARKRFSREAQAAAAVVHEHVVAIHAVDNSSKLPFIVMPYIPGRSLQERLDANGPLETKEVLRIGIQAAAGLAAAHAQGLVHRDIKPANILLENGIERVRITDFGLARAVDDASQTQSGFIAGTPQYMAPEQARGEPVDHRADLFSLGSVMYAMCSGHPPFRAETTLAVLRRICEETPRPLQETNPDIPEWLQAVISKLHARDSAKRFQSAAEVSALLEQYLAHLQQPLVNPMPQFHTPKRAITFLTRFNWKRAGLWSVPALLATVLLFLVALVRLAFVNENPHRQDFAAQNNIRSEIPVSIQDRVPIQSPSVVRDPWGGWQNSLNEASQDLSQLELEMGSHLTVPVDFIQGESTRDLERSLDQLEQELRRR